MLIGVPDKKLATWLGDKEYIMASDEGEAVAIAGGYWLATKERVDFVEEIRRLTNKKIIVDIDTGGSLEHLPFYIRWFQKAGAYAVIIEDKKYPKQNSLLEEATQHLEEVDVFCEKIKVAKKNAGKMLVFARLESLIAKKSVYDALLRAEAYVIAGADGIMIHSKKQIDASEVMEFADNFRKNNPGIPLIAVPTAYVLPEQHPFDIVIEANMLLRASMKAMQNYIDGKEIDLETVENVFKLLGY